MGRFFLPQTQMNGSPLHSASLFLLKAVFFLLKDAHEDTAVTQGIRSDLRTLCCREDKQSCRHDVLRSDEQANRCVEGRMGTM